nr:uncharacterized protein LOC129438959 [Misgurnus anguillicaudatus]
MDRPVKFKETTQNIRLRRDEATSPAPSCTSLQSDQSMDRPVKFKETTQNIRLRRDEATSPAPSCTSLQSDQSMDRPVKFKETTQNIRLRRDEATSPAPSCTSLQSDQSMDRPVKFKETTQNIRLRRDEATSPAPSCTSLQSDQSMDRPVKFKETTQNIRLRPDEATSPAPSCTSLQSDQSMGRPIMFQERTQDIRLRPDEATSSAPSCTSLQSDQSMDRPVKFKETTQNIRLRRDEATSPAPSCTSLQSDQSMDRPVKFKETTQNIGLRRDEATSPAPSCTSLQSDQSMDRPVKFKEATQNIRLRRDEATSPAPSCTSLQSDQSMDRPVKFKETTSDIRLRPDEPASPVPSCTSLQSDKSMDRPVKFKETTSDISVIRKNVKEPFRRPDSSWRKEAPSPDISTLSATLLTEDHYRCSVCTEVFKNPVSIPCGHSYCKHCIEIYWSKPTQAECYACPQCRKRFRDRPVLYVNVPLTKLIDELQWAGFSPALPAHCYAGPEDVSCDICTDMKLKAVKSCLTCCVSYCETHVRQHYTVPALQRHNLMEPCSLSCDTETTGISSAEKRFQEDNKVLTLTATVTKLKSILKEKDAQAKRFCKGIEVHCKDLPSDIIEVSALGHPLCLGMLYDTKSDYYSQTSFLWSNSTIASMRVSLPRPQTDVKILEGNSLQDRFRALEISPVSRTKALNGEVNGAAAFLNHPIQSEHQDRVTLHYKTTTRLDMISPTLLHEGVSPSVINTTTATHVIIAVSYGAQAFFVFDRRHNNSKKTAEMKDVIKKLSSSSCASQTSSSLNDNEKAMSLLYNCSLYIDVGDWKSPVSFKKAMKIYDSLPELLGSQGEKAVPLKVWLYPLKKLERTSACAALSGVNGSFTQRAENILEHLNKQIKKCQDFMTSTDNLSVIIWFPALKDKLVDFSELLQKYKADCQRGITEIKNSEAKVEEGEKKLRHFIETHDRSPFSADNINQWLENKETELKILNDCKTADITVVKSQSELHQIINDPQINRVMCFTLTSPDDEDSFLTALKHHIESDHITPTDSLQSKPVKINQKVLIDLQLYIAAKEANEDTEQTRFIAASEPDNEFPEFTVQFYYAGMIVSRNMKFGVKPDLAQITQIKHNSVSVKWNHSQKKSIERFVVEYRVVGDDGINNNTWKQITVYNHTFKEECVISSLKPDTEYQLRYAVCGNNSMSNFSWFIYFKTSSVARPRQPSVTKLSRDTLRLTWLKAEADEDCPVLQYMVEYREAGLEGWSSVLTQGPQCECTLTLPHSTCYRVRVSAVYEDITSKPSEETSVPVDVWAINLSERKTSILLEVLKLQIEKKPVELIDWTDDESEVRGFILCLPYISQLRFEENVFDQQRKMAAVQFLMKLSVAASELDTNTNENFTELLTSVCSYTTFPCDESNNNIGRCDFLLDLFSNVKDYESQTDRSPLPALQSIYQSSPAVWTINLSERKTSILLEVLKLQTEKKPVELIDCTDDESEVRGFIQCLPYISQLRVSPPQRQEESFKDWEERKRLSFLNLCLQVGLCQEETLEEYMDLLLPSVYDGKCDFLLDLYSHVRDYESQTDRSLLPALQSFYQSAPDVWTINLLKRKTSILLEVLKLQTEKKPVELIDWTDDESEMRGFIQCLPYISQLSFYKDILHIEKEKRSAFQFLLNLNITASELASPAQGNSSKLITSVCSYTSFPCVEENKNHIGQSDFLLDLYSHVKDYESQTGSSVLPALQSIYQSPAVWTINLSERKTSILLEVLKLQTEKKPVELIDWTDDESELRGFIQCLQYISQLRVYLPQKQEESFKDWEKRKRLPLLNLCLQAALCQEENLEEYMNTLLPSVHDGKCDFLLDLYSHVKDYESQTGRSLLPALQSIYHSPEVWIINLSERKTSILLEVLKLQTEKKPVELIDWTDDESEVRGFIQCLPYISQLSFYKDVLHFEKEKRSAFQFLLNLSITSLELDSSTQGSFNKLITSVCSYTSFPCDEKNNNHIGQCDFLLDLYSHVKDYESQTGRSVLPALQSIYQSSPAVWTINLSERKTSILLEVLKLETEKKPVELIDWTDDESEVRGFIQCLPYISQLRLLSSQNEHFKVTDWKMRFAVLDICLQVAVLLKDITREESLFSFIYYGECDFLLDLYSHVKDYESETGRSLLPALQSIYQSSPAIWTINLSERKTSILLEVLKLQTEKKPVELIDWTDDESEVRGFIQCLPYISQLRFCLMKSESSKKRERRKRLLALNLCLQDPSLLREILETSMAISIFSYIYHGSCDFLLDLCSHVKEYGTETGRSVLPALQSIYQSSPAVWTINLSERKTSILLEVLKLQTEKKPVELIDWTDDESEVRGFIQCLPYISQLRFCLRKSESYQKKERRERLLALNLCLQSNSLLREILQTSMESLFSYIYHGSCDSLLDLCSHVKDYESQTGSSVLPALQSIYQSPAVWYINLSERKTSILLEVLKLQTEKKPVELIDWTDDESEVRGFIQCLPYISQLRLPSLQNEDSKFTGWRLRISVLDMCLQVPILQKIITETSMDILYSYISNGSCNFLLDLYPQIKVYETQTGRDVFPVLQVFFKSTPAVWTINLSERKTSILLEVLKLQTEKKPVELIDWTDDESEVRGFIQCLPYISQLRSHFEARGVVRRSQHVEAGGALFKGSPLLSISGTVSGGGAREAFGSAHPYPTSPRHTGSRRSAAGSPCPSGGPPEPEEEKLKSQSCVTLTSAYSTNLRRKS